MLDISRYSRTSEGAMRSGFPHYQGQMRNECSAGTTATGLMTGSLEIQVASYLLTSIVVSVFPCNLLELLERPGGP